MSKAIKKKKNKFVVYNCLWGKTVITGVYNTLEEAKEESTIDDIILEVVSCINVTDQIVYEKAEVEDYI